MRFVLFGLAALLFFGWVMKTSLANTVFQQIQATILLAASVTAFVGALVLDELRKARIPPKKLEPIRIPVDPEEAFDGDKKDDEHVEEDGKRNGGEDGEAKEGRSKKA